jgi:hypothetical protein
MPSDLHNTSKDKETKELFEKLNKAREKLNELKDKAKETREKLDKKK